MATKRGLSGTGIHRNRGGGSRFPIAILIFFSLLAPLVFFVGRGLYTTTTSIDQNDTAASKQVLNWRERLALQHVKSLFSREIIDVIKANTNDLGPLSLDSFRKNNLSASWKFVGQEIPFEENYTSAEANQVAATTKQETPRGKRDDSSDDDHSQFVDTPAKLARRQLREKKREKRAADLVKQDDDVYIFSAVHHVMFSA